MFSVEFRDEFLKRIRKRDFIEVSMDRSTTDRPSPCEVRAVGQFSQVGSAF